MYSASMNSSEFYSQLKKKSWSIAHRMSYLSGMTTKEACWHWKPWYASTVIVCSIAWIDLSADSSLISRF